ncbi:MAG: ankyrin repeat domain-containing protein [Treponema sp.]|nr:ankyrin repeat domain-containing protein [Treponema sp.]
MKHLCVKIAAAFGAVLFFSCISAPKNEKPETIVDLVKQGRYEEAKERFGSKEDLGAQDEDGNTALHLAARLNEADLCSFLIIKGADIEATNTVGNTPILEAVKNGSFEATKVLATMNANIFAKDVDEIPAIELALAQGPDWYDTMINQQTGKIRSVDGESIVHYFVKTKDETAIDICIRNNIPLSVKDNGGNTPLAVAFQDAKDSAAIRIAAKLILAGSELVRGDFDYFEDSIKTHNVMLRFHDGQTPLHIATISGHTGIVDYLLKNNGSIRIQDMLQAQDISGASPLHEAVRYGHADIVKLLLASGANVNALDAMGKTPFLLIIPVQSQQAIYTQLLGAGAKATQKDMYGDTVLHIVTMGDTTNDVLKLLVARGAPINERNKQGVTPLQLAVEKNLGAHVLFYANSGADINAEDMQSNTPLTLALHKKTSDMIQTLITKQNVNSKDSSGNTPLHTAILHDAPFEYIQYIVSTGADVNARNKDGDSVLYLATQKNMKNAGELLIDKGADIFATNMQNYSPLRLALEEGGDVQDWIITSRTMNMTDGSGNTPLHYASEWKLDNAVLSLIEKGAKINATNANGETALFSAVKADSPSTINVLAENGIVTDARNNLTRDHLGNTPLHAAGRWNAMNAAQTLLLFGMNVNAQNLSGKTPLSDCCRSGKTEMAQLLIANGADVNATDVTGRSVLLDAVQAHNENMVSLLLRNGANPQIQDMSGRNAYHEAAMNTNIAIITMLRNAGGNPLSRDRYGETPFSLVLRSNDENLIRTILGSNTMIVDSDGNTPVHIAVERKASAKLITMLLNMGYPTNQRNAKGITPLYQAITSNQRTLINVLLERGADPFVSTTDGDSALLNAITNKNTAVLDVMVKYCGTKTDMQGDSLMHYAARAADAETIKHLLSLNIDRKIKNFSGETPADMAARWGRHDIEMLLR